MKLKIIMLNTMDKSEMTKSQIISLHPELRNIGYADGQNIGGPLSEDDKNKMIKSFLIPISFWISKKTDRKNYFTRNKKFKK